MSYIGIFDSGLGGLSVLSECRRLLPNEDYLFYADIANAPFGNYPARKIQALTQQAVKKMLAFGLKALVIACNTATCAAIPHLRRRYPDKVIIGMEPAVKPAIAACPAHKKVLVLCTAATAKQDKFSALVATLNAKNIVIAPQHNLAAQIERAAPHFWLLKPQVEAILAPHRNGLGAVVLGCTHYVFLRGLFIEVLGESAIALDGNALSGNSGSFRDGAVVLDGNAGTARRLKALLAERDLLNPRTECGKTILTASASLPPSYLKLL